MKALAIICASNIYDFVSFHAVGHAGRLSTPYFACHAKKYAIAAIGCPNTQKKNQKIRFPASFAFRPFIFANGSVMKIRGNCNTMPKNATKRML